MPNSTKTALLAVLSVLVAAALIFAGILLGMDPQVDQAMRGFLGWNSTSTASNQTVGASTKADIDLQKEIIQKLESSYYKYVDPGSLGTGAIDGMLSTLNDPYTVYYTPQEYSELQEEESGSYGGVGMVMAMYGRFPVVLSVFDGSPSAEANIQAGDVILSVDGASVSGQTLEQVVSDIKGNQGSTVKLEMFRPATPLTTTTTTLSPAQGNASTTTTTSAHETTDTLTIDLTGLPSGGTTKEYTLTRRTIEVPITDMKILNDSGKKVAYIILYTFAAENVAQQLRDDVQTAMTQDKVDDIVLDLRGNLGGILDQAVKVASIFIKSGVIVSTEGLHYAKQDLDAAGDAIAPNIPLYVLTDKNSASASEILAGALQDYGRATLIGTTTFGKGLVQQIEPLSNGGAVKVTIEVYLTPKGRDINQKGIAPDYVAPDNPATKNVDETLQKALDLIATGKSAK